jgi:hypothetical protein
MRQFEMYNNISEYIETFETKRAEQLVKKKAKAKGIEEFIEE